MADHGDKKQVGVMLSPAAVALSDSLAEMRTETGRPKWTRSDLIEALIWDAAKAAKVEPDAKEVKRITGTIGAGKAGKSAR
jgi:hypothetical protein